MKNLKLTKGLSRNEMKNILGGKAFAPKEFNCWCDGIRNGYCTGETVDCCGAPTKCDGSIVGSN